MRRAIGATLVVLAAATGLRAGPRQAPAKTTRDGVYTKDQAARGGKLYGSLCRDCHEPGAVLPPGTKPGPPLTGDPFLTKWKGRTLGELMTQIETTMPNDGSAFLDDAQTADITAYMLQANGFPDGQAALAMGGASSGIVIATHARYARPASDPRPAPGRGRGCRSRLRSTKSGRCSDD
jgi:mono/diheme cytochrome c family protein